METQCCGSVRLGQKGRFFGTRDDFGVLPCLLKYYQMKTMVYERY